MLTMVALLLSMNVFAQRDATIDAAIRLTKGGGALDVNYKITKPLSSVMVDDKNLRGNETQDKATLEIISFGTKGNTVLLTISDSDGPSTISWSGKNIHVYPLYLSDVGGFLVVKGNLNSDLVYGGLFVYKGKWIAKFTEDPSTNNVRNTMLKKGLSRTEVEKQCSQLRDAQFKFSRKSGNLDVYTCYWLGTSEYSNSTVLTNNKPWCDFYFDSKDKLVKWLYLY